MKYLVILRCDVEIDADNQNDAQYMADHLEVIAPIPGNGHIGLPITRVQLVYTKRTDATHHRKE